MLALYRKYRPTRLADVIGEDQVTKNLESSLKKGKISHAYLFTGPRGCGKTSVARIFAHEINGFKYELEDFYPDIIEIDAASNTGVDNIRELREKAMVSPSAGKYKVYIIDEVHMLSKSAFNALLKTLEEPPEHVVFIMATTDAYKVPGTIVSRSQVYEFQLAPPETMLKHLEKIAQAENVKITTEALEIIVRRGGGSFRDSISLLDQISTIKDTEITAEDLEKALGLPENDQINRLFEAYRSANLAEISEALKRLLNSGVRAEVIAEELIKAIVDHPAPDLLPLLGTLPSVSAPFPEAKLLLAFTSSLATAPSPAPAPVINNGAGDRNPKGPSDNASETRFEKIFDKEGSRAPFSGYLDSNNLRESDVSNRPLGRGKPQAYASEGPFGSVSGPAPNIEGRAPEGPDTEISPSGEPSGSAPGPAPNGKFAWPEYLESVAAQSPSLADILKKTTQQEPEPGTIALIPEKNIYKTILESPNNAKILKQCLPENYKLEIANPNSSVISTNNPLISKISAIMGNVKEVEVKDGGNIPF